MADTIRRVKRRSNFTTVNNDYLQDKKLSWKAKGLITYVMSLPSDWTLNLSDLKNRSKDGRDATAAGIRELIQHGYCQRSKLRDNGGLFGGFCYEVSDIKEFDPEQPQTENPSMVEPQTENPQTGNPKTVNPETENPTLINTNSTKDLIKPNTIGKKSEKDFSAQLFPDEQTESKKDKKTLFRNSDIYALVKFDENGVGIDYSEFEKKYATPEFAPVDLVYYFHVVADWSDQKNMKRTKNGWLATVRNFIRGDVERKKVHLKKEHQAPQTQLNVSGAMDFLNEYD